MSEFYVLMRNEEGTQYLSFERGIMVWVFTRKEATSFLDRKLAETLKTYCEQTTTEPAGFSILEYELTY